MPLDEDHPPDDEDGTETPTSAEVAASALKPTPELPATVAPELDDPSPPAPDDPPGYAPPLLPPPIVPPEAVPPEFSPVGPGGYGWGLSVQAITEATTPPSKTSPTCERERLMNPEGPLHR
jgi:hypothetical protein